ncbi:MAG: hypothetical protein ACE5GA_08570, partial [Candidatus Zixiibacteriota bacterium]
MFEADLTGGATDTHDPRDARGGGPGYSRARRLLRGSLADQALTNALDHDRLAGALLFYGPSGVGKWAAASLLAAALNCPRRDKDSALGSEHEWNPASRQIFAGSFPDFLWVAPQPSSKNETEEMELANDFFQQKRHEPLKVVRWSRPSRISIERARRIKRRLFQTPAPGVTRVVVFYEIETMAHGAVDSLLKMIEEPPP